MELKTKLENSLITYIEFIDQNDIHIRHAWATKHRARFVPKEGISIDWAA